MDFEIVIDSALLKLVPEFEPSPAEKKYVLSLANDYEDGMWRTQKFQNFVWDNIAETALSLKEREALAGQPYSMLRAAAQNLRLTDSEKDISKGSELAEIVLYGIMKHKYGALPVVPKIFYKQNTQDNAKGADSVHIVAVDKNEFTLWFGEAKFYNSIEDSRLLSVIQSVRNSLATDKLKKENSIITNVSDLDHLNLNDNLRENIKSALSNKNSIDTIKPRIHIPILLLHECAITREHTEYSDEYIAKIAQWHTERATTYFAKQIAQLQDIKGYGVITFHLILLPVPEKEPIIDAFVSTVTAHRD